MRINSLLLILCLAVFIPSAHAETPILPEDLVVIGAQPAVFMVFAKADIEATYPSTIRLRVDRIIEPWRNPSDDEIHTVLANEYERDRRDGVIPDARSTVDYYWEKIVENPDKYLETGNKETQLLKDVEYSYGTGFAVSREGILLTNAHVVSDPPDGTLPPILKKRFIESAGSYLTEKLGGSPSEAVIPQLLQSLVQWFESQSQANGKFKQAEVVLKFEREPRKKYSYLPLMYQWGEWFEGLISTPERLTVFAKVLAKGDTIPGKDVAILKIGFTESEGGISGETLAEVLSKIEIIEDKLICLSLGDSDLVLPQTRIHALGFPGSAFDPSLMSPDAEFRVSFQDGEIGIVKPMRGGWNALEMTALIHYGDSGGPVVDKQGKVIGLNVGTANPQAARLTLAVPINVAKEFLKQAGINPDPGPLTLLWVDGLRFFSNGRYDEALRRFEKVQNIQGGKEARQSNPYVGEMIARSKKKLGLIP